MDREAAEEYTDSLAQIFAGSWRQVLWARNQGIPDAVGLTVDEWVRQRLGGYVKMAIPERREAVKELTAPIEEGGQGLSTREAAEVLGVAHETIARDARAVTNVTPDPEKPKAERSSAVTNVTPEPGDEEDAEPTEPDANADVEHVPEQGRGEEVLPESPRGFEFAHRQKETEEEKAYHHLVQVTLWAKLNPEEVASVCPNLEGHLHLFEHFGEWVQRFVEALEAQRSRPLRAVK